MEVVDPADIARHERCAEVFQRMVAAGSSYEDILKGCDDGAKRAEAVGNAERVDDFILMGSWAKFRLNAQRDAVEQGKAVSDRMAAAWERNQYLHEAAIAIKPEIRKIGPSHDELQRRRDWNARAKGMDLT